MIKALRNIHKYVQWVIGAMLRILLRAIKSVGGLRLSRQNMSYRYGQAVKQSAPWIAIFVMLFYAIGLSLVNNQQVLAATSTLIPGAGTTTAGGDGTDSGGIVNEGATACTGAVCANSIDETVASADGDTTYNANTGGSSGTQFYQLTDMDSLYSSMNSVSIDVRCKEVGSGNDTLTLGAIIYASNESTILADNGSGGAVQLASFQGNNNCGSGAYATISAASLTVNGANDTKANWDGARLALIWTYNQAQGPDSLQMYVTAAEVDIDYNQSSATTQDHFRWRNDDGSESTATWQAAEDSNAIGNVAKGSVLRLRFEVGRVATTDAAARAYRLEWTDRGAGSCESGDESWIRLDTASDDFALYNSTNVTNGTATTNQLNTGSGTHVNGEIVDLDTSDDDTSGSIGALNANENTEIEYTFEVGATAGNGNTYCFRVTDAGTALDGYSVYPELTTPPPSPLEITQEAYIFENDDGANVNSNTNQVSFNTALTGVKKGERLNARFHVKNTSGAPGNVSDFGLFYDRSDGIFTKVEQNQLFDNGVGNCNDTTWDCSSIDATGATDIAGQSTSIAFDPSGNAWVSYYDETNQDLYVAQYVGSGGTGCDQSTAWTCTAVDDSGSAGIYSSMAIDSAGNPWIAYQDTINFNLNVAQYVGSGGTGCSLTTAWTCTAVDVTDNAGRHARIAFDHSGNAWVSYLDNTNFIMMVAQYVGSGGTGCDGGSSAWTCTAVDATGTSGASLQGSIAFDPSGNAWVSYYDGNLAVAQYVGSGGTGCDQSTAWTCTAVDVTDSVGIYSTITFNPSGNAWVSYYDSTDTNFMVAQYVGSGGTGCDGGSSSWTCTAVDVTDDVGQDTSIAFDPSGNAWVSYYDFTDTNFMVAQYVGSGGTGCDGGSSAWTCTAVDVTDDVGHNTSIAFDPSGNAWVSYYDITNGNLKVAQIVRSGEITVSPGLSGDNGDALTASDADDGAGGTDCATATTFVNGIWFEAEEGKHFFDDDQCTEISFSIDTSQATEGTTYRLALATKDNWRADNGPWRGPIAIDNYATLTIEADTDIRYAKDNTAHFATCTDTEWGCEIIDAAGNDTGEFASIAFDPSGKPWVAYKRTSTIDIVIAEYVGSGGNCDDSGGSDAWQCTVVEDDSTFGRSGFSLSISNKGIPWISYGSGNFTALKVAHYVGSGGNCDDSGGSDAWQCDAVIQDGGSGINNYTSIAFDKNDNPWFSWYNVDGATSDTLYVANYVGSGGNCDDLGPAGSDAWECTQVDSTVADTGYATSLAFDQYGVPWISYWNGTNGSLMVANYVGSGGNCTSSKWDCTEVDNSVTSTGQWTSLAFDANGTAWVTYRNVTGTSLMVATYTGTGTETSCIGAGSGSADWDCIEIDGSADTGFHTSISFDSTNTPWVSYFNTSIDALMVATRTGTGTETSCIGLGTGSADWDCSAVDSAGNTGHDTSMAIDPSGVPWVSYARFSGDGTCDTAGECHVKIAKLHLPTTPPSANAQITNPNRSAGSGDARYRLDDQGYTDVSADDTALDDNAAILDQRPFYTFSKEFSSTAEPPGISWIGQSSVSMATNNTTVEVYRFGTTNAWQTLTTESTCAADVDCTIEAAATGTASEFYEDVGGGEYAAYFRIWQDAHTTDQTLKTDVVEIFQPAPGQFNQRAYIFENDDGTSADTNTPLAAANTSIEARKGERLNLRAQLENTNDGLHAATDFGLFYDRNDGIWSKVQNQTPPVTGNGTGCASSDWTCKTIDDSLSSPIETSVAISPDGQPWVAYDSEPGDNLKVARFVGSGGNGCSGSTTSGEWSCEVVDLSSGTDTGDFAEIAFAPDGSAWIAYNYNSSDLRVARYVGSGGDCDSLYGGSDAWQCWAVDTTSAVNFYKGITFDASGNPIIAYYDATSTSLMLTTYVGGAAGSGCDSTDWDGCSVIDDDGSPTDLDIVTDGNGKLWIGYAQTANLKVAEYVGSGGSGCATGVTDWHCYLIHNDGNPASYAVKMDVAPNGKPSIAYFEAAGNDLWYANYVGAGNTGGCDVTGLGAGDDAGLWDCTEIIATDDVGRYPDLAFDAAGNAWISYHDFTTGNLDLEYARFVGGGNGSGCASSDWSCEVIDSADDVGGLTGIAFKPDGNPIISYRDDTNFALKFATIERGGEITVAPSHAADNGDVLAESHADMTSVTDTANRDDADCISGTFASGVHSTLEEINQAFGANACQELSFTIDTSQAQPNTTYRFALASEDGWIDYINPWRGPVAITNFPTVSIKEDSDIRYSKTATYDSGTDCTGNTEWSCEDLFIGAESVDYQWNDIAIAPDGTPWAVYRNNEAFPEIIVAQFVGDGTGNCNTVPGDGGGSTDWQCWTVFDGGEADDGEFPSITFTSDGEPWVTWRNDESTGDDLVIANYVGSGGNCDGYDDVGGSDAWQCEAIIDTLSSNGVDQASFLAVGPNDELWLTAREGSGLMTFNYVGSGGNCDGYDGPGGSDAWQCEEIYDGDLSGDGSASAITVDKYGIPWVALTNDETTHDLVVAHYVGSGGSCVAFDGPNGSDAWNCETVYVGNSDGDAQDLSIAVDANDTVWVAGKDEEATADDLFVAQYTGSGTGTCASFDAGGGSANWDCTNIYDGADNNDGGWTNMVIDSTNTPVIQSYNNESLGEATLSRYVGTGGNCNTIDNGGSTAWECTTMHVGEENGTGSYGALAIDNDGIIWSIFGEENTASTSGYTVIAKQKLSSLPPSTDNNLPYNSQNGGNSDARYRLTDGRAPKTDLLGKPCATLANAGGYCGVFESQGQYDALTTNGSERPVYVGAVEFESNAQAPTIFWQGRTNLAPSTASAAGDIVIEAYRFGTTNAWESVVTDSTSTDCTTTYCQVSGMPTGTTSEYFEADGSEYWFYFRVYQVGNNSTSITFQVDQLTALQTAGQLRGGRQFQDGVLRPFDTN